MGNICADWTGDGVLSVVNDLEVGDVPRVDETRIEGDSQHAG
ncbi:MAG: hypothetical protein R3C02_09020 [Planctomycetaceae bacterium]